MLRSLRPLLFAFAVASIACVAPPAAAEPIPFSNKPVQVVGRGQKIDLFLRDLFGQAGLQIKPSTTLTGTIQGTFNGKPADIWVQMSKAFNLVAYYNGSVVRIYNASEIQSRTLPAPSPASVVAEAKRLRLTDSNNSVTAGSSHVMASGVPEFLTRVATLAGTVSPPRPAVVPVKAPPLPPSGVATVQTDVISPIARAGAGGARPSAATIPTAGPTGNYAAVRSTVRSYATARFPYEVRVFYLRYAKAQDVVVTKGGIQTITPGVATILRGVMGDGRASETSVSTSGNYETAKHAIPHVLAGEEARGTRGDYSDDEDDGPSQRRRPREGDVNGPRIEVDQNNNAVLVRDRPEAMQTYENIIASLDIEQRGIELEATIVELNTSRMKDLGLDLAFRSGGLSAIFGGQVAQTDQGPSGVLQGSLLTGSGTIFSARLTALEKSGTARVVSKPRVSTLNNVEAEFGDRTEAFIPLRGERVASVQTVQGGLIFRVTPQIMYDGGELRTRLEIYIEDGSVSRDVNGDPVVKRANLNTTAIVKQGEALLIGGMTVASQYDYKSKTPILGDVPVLGNAFKKRQKGGERFERLFLITPRILSQGNAAVAGGATKTELIPIEMLEGRRPSKPKGRKDAGGGTR
jgi:type III secretion protein C